MRGLDWSGHGHGSHWHRVRDDGADASAAALDAHFHVPALELKLGDIFFYQEIDKLFQLFLIHECFRLSSVPIRNRRACWVRHGVKA